MKAHCKQSLILAIIVFVWCGLLGPTQGGCAAAVVSTACALSDAPSLAELSKLQLAQPVNAIELNPAAIPAAACTAAQKARASSAKNATAQQQQASAPANARPDSQRPSPATSSSQDLLKYLAITVLAHNLMPQPLAPAWALATTASAWLYLTFDRLLPWLPKSAPASSSAGPDAVAAAAGLSPTAAAAASPGASIGGDARWWQHALLFLELFWGNAVDAVLMMGLLLLPVIVLRRWLAGKRLWGSVPGLSNPAGAAADGAAAAAEPAGGAAALGGADGGFLPNAARAARSSVEGIGAQLLSAGDRAARLAKAMQKVGSSGRLRRYSRADSAASSSSGTDSDHSAGSSSSGSSGGSSSTASMVSPEQSIAKPMTPPLMYAARPDGPLGAPAFTAAGMRLAQPLAPSPTSEQVNAGRTAAAVAAGTAAPPHPAPKGPSTPTAFCPTAAGRDSSSDPRTLPSDSTRRTPPGDQQHSQTVAPSGSRSSSGGSSGGRASLNLGAVGIIRTLPGRGQPGEPGRVLYNSPLETVVISCKLAARSSSSSVQGSSAPRLAGTSTSNGTSGGGSGAGGASAPTYSAGPAVAAAAGHQAHQAQPLNPVLARYSGSSEGHSDSLSAQRELRAVVESAVRQAVAAANVAVVSTSVTSFPGCVHVVTTADLTAAALQALAATTAAGGETGELQSPAAAEAAASGSLADRVVWELVVQQVVGTSQAHAADSTSSGGFDSSGSEGVAGVLARHGLYLQHLLVQDRSGQVRYLWVSPEAARADVAVFNASPERGSVMSEPGSPLASSSTSSSGSTASMQAVHSKEWQISELLSAAAGTTLSCFALPTDAAEADTLAGAAASKPMLLMPPGAAASLPAAGAGLRVVVSASPHSPAATTAGSLLRVSAGDSAGLGTTGGYGHLLADHTLWPDSSSWAAGAEIDLSQLLPANAALLAERCGPVLTVNVTASMQHGSTAGSSAAGQTPAEGAVVPDSAAGIVLSTMAAGVPDAAPVHAQQQHPVRAASADEVHQGFAQLVCRLSAGPAATDLVSGEGGSHAPAGPSAAPTSSVPAQQAVQAGDEHLLLQVPLLLLPSAACQELSRLQQEMQAELGPGAAAAAGMHMLALVRDIAAMLIISCGSTAAPASGPAQQQQRPGTQQQPELNSTHKHQLKLVLQYLSDQSCDALAATISSHLGLHDTAQLMLQEQQGPPAAPLAHLTQEIQAADTSCLTPATSETAADPAQQPMQSPSTSAATAGSSEQRPADAARNSKQAAKALAQASAAQDQAAAAQRAAAATESALRLALEQISALSAAAAGASHQAAEAQAAAAAASQRAAAVEEEAERQRALQLIASPAGAPAGGARGVGIWGLLGGHARAVTAARAAGSALLGGAMRAGEPPLVPAVVAPRDVLLGFEDERLEVQYRRLKALQCRSVDKAALLMQLFRQVVYVWRIARLLYASSGTGLSLVLLCKYEAVVLLPYVMMLLTPDFFTFHRQLLLCLSQIAAAATVGMIATTEVYRNEWSALLQHPGPTLLARPSMMVLWYYLIVPLLQQQTLPEQALSCVAQLGHSLLIFVFILRGTTSLFLVVPLLLAASAVSFAVAYAADYVTRQQAVAAAHRSLGGHVH